MVAKVDKTQLRGKLSKIGATGYAILNVPHDMQQLVISIKKKSASKFCTIKKFKETQSANLLEVVPLHTAKELRSITKNSASTIINSALCKYNAIIFFVT